MRVGLLNVRFSPNLGDGLLAECMEKELAASPGVSKVVSIDLVGRLAYGQGGLRNRETAIRVLGAMPRPLRRFVAASMLKLLVVRKLRPYWREAMKDLDVLVLGGGNLIADHDLNFPIKIAGALHLAAEARLPVAVFGVGVSEDWSRVAQGYLDRAFDEVRLIYAAVRDERSQGLWRERFAFPATTCRDPGLLASRCFAPRPRSGGGRRVGLGLTDPVALSYHGGAAVDEAQFTAWYAELAQGLVARGQEVVLFTNGSPEDRAYLRRASEVIQAKAPEVRVEPDFRDPGELSGFVSSLDLLLAHRLHACIAAYSFGVPHLSFDWDSKMRSFFTAVGRSAFLVEAVQTPADEVLGLADEALRAGLEPGVRAAVLADAGRDIERLREALLREVRPSAAPSRPERIVVINDSTVAGGGATALALRSALELRARGYAVTFLAGDHGANAELESAGVEVVSIGQERLLASSPAKALINGLYNPAAERMVADWIARNDTPATIYHLHGWAQILSPAIFRPLNRIADRLVLSAHDFFLTCPNGAYADLKSGAVCELTPMSLQCVAANCDRRSYGHKLWRVARHAVRQWAFDLGERAPPVLAIHAAMRPFLVRGGVPESAVVTLPNPVMPFLEARAPAERNSDFLFIGRLEPGKGPDLAAAAAAQAGVALTVIGDGPMSEAIQRDYPQAKCVGRLSPREIAPLAQRARALVMPSRYPEPYGLVAAEALWSGLPVISADTAFLSTDIVAAGAGFACPPRDTPALAARMRAIAADDVLTERMSHNAYERTRGIGLTLPAWMDALETIYLARAAGEPVQALVA